MIRIEQVRLLEQRVHKVIGRITDLQQENTTLREQLQAYQDRISDLEKRIEGFASNQEEIEAGILNALQRLDEVEDSVGSDVAENLQVEADVPPESSADAAHHDETTEPLQDDPSAPRIDDETADGDAEAVARSADDDRDSGGADTASDTEGNAEDADNDAEVVDTARETDREERAHAESGEHTMDKTPEDTDIHGTSSREAENDDHESGPELDIF